MVGPTGKKGCGIVGQNRHYHDHPFEMDLPFNFRAHILAQTRQMLNVGDGNAILHSEATPARIKTQRDNSVQSNIVRIQAIA